ncbi:MAG: glycosyltransferase family 4 protein [Caldilineaceae bacterium]|nr:glycosyltransferase family 4 protein [Caldilineaceae bacterium]
MNQPIPRLRLLHLILATAETNGQYNEHCLPMAEQRDITICTYFRCEKPVPSSLTLFEGNNSVPSFLQKFRDAWRANTYDAVHAHVPHTGILLLLALLRYLLWRQVMPITVYTVQNSFQNYKLRNRLLMLPIFALFQRVVFCGQACMESYPAWMLWLVGRRAEVVPNAVDIDRVDRILTTTPRIAHPFTVVSVGRLIDIKNPFTLLQAFRTSLTSQGKGQPPETAPQLVFVGEGNRRQALAAECATLDLSAQVTLTGLVDRDSVFRHVANGDLFVSTSRGEGLPVAVIEAMACGCPVVLSDIPPHREIAQHTSVIPLLDCDDVAGFAAAIARFQAMTPAERQQIGAECRRVVERHFSLNAMHKQLESIYRSLALCASNSSVVQAPANPL